MLSPLDGVETMAIIKHIVQFDKTFLSGNLEGITVPGQCISFPSYKTAQRYSAYLEHIIQGNDFCRDYSSGARFTVANIQVFPA